MSWACLKAWMTENLTLLSGSRQMWQKLLLHGSQEHRQRRGREQDTTLQGVPQGPPPSNWAPPSLSLPIMLSWYDSIQALIHLTGQSP